jgi:hypothetical protein
LANSQADVTVSVCTELADGTDRRWLSEYGQVSGLQYGTIAPGGPKAMSGKLSAGPNFHGAVAAPGRIVRAYSGGFQTWSGRMDEPQPTADGISFTATGIMAEGDDYSCISSNNALLVDTQLDDAIARGMNWTRLNNTPSLFGVQPLGITINAALQAAMDLHGQPWWTTPAGDFFWFVWPTTPIYTLTAVSDGGGRTRDGMFTDLAAVYLNSSGAITASGFTSSVGLRTKLGRKEKVLDLTGNGNYAAGSPPAAVTTAKLAELALNGIRAAWTGSLPAPRGLLRTLGGAVVEPAVVQAGQMTQVQLQDAGQWGETASTAITFIIGETLYDQDSDSVALTPLQSSLNTLASALRR